MSLTKGNFRRGAGLIALTVSLVWCAPALGDETVQVCGSYGNNVFTSGTVAGITATGRCPTPSYNGGGFSLFESGNSTRGETGRWQTAAPAGLELVGATANQIVSTGVNDGADFGGGFYYAGGGTQVNNSTPATVGMMFPSPSSYFGMQLICGKSNCSQFAIFAVGAFALRAGDEWSGLQCSAWALADDGVDQGDVAVGRVGRFSIRSLLALRDPERAANQHDHIRARPVELAPVRGSTA